MFMKEVPAGHQEQLAYNAACSGFMGKFTVTSSLRLGMESQGAQWGPQVSIVLPVLGDTSKGLLKPEGVLMADQSSSPTQA